jgi:hypothetical protein
LKQCALEENQSLPFELVYEFSEGDTEVVVLLPFLVLEQLWQTLGETL